MKTQSKRLEITRGTTLRLGIRMKMEGVLVDDADIEFSVAERQGSAAILTYSSGNSPYEIVIDDDDIAQIVVADEVTADWEKPRYFYQIAYIYEDGTRDIPIAGTIDVRGAVA